jgi:branched-chain amino acid transport system ATP-binding protein
VLEIKDLDVFYGNIHALQSLNLHVDQGEMVALLGANGAGKTTTLAAISVSCIPAAELFVFAVRI